MKIWRNVIRNTRSITDLQIRFWWWNWWGLLVEVHVEYMVETSSWWVGTYMRCIVDDVGIYWWFIVDDWLTHDWYILGTWLDALIYGTGWLQVGAWLMHLFMAQVGAWLMLLFMVQIDICWGLLPHLSWCWEWKLSLAYRAGALVDLYSIQLLLINPKDCSP